MARLNVALNICSVMPVLHLKGVLLLEGVCNASQCFHKCIGYVICKSPASFSAKQYLWCREDATSNSRFHFNVQVVSGAHEPAKERATRFHDNTNCVTRFQKFSDFF